MVTLVVTGLLSAGLAGQSVLSGIGANRSPDWVAALLAGIGEAWPWLIWTPLVLWLTERFPFGARNWVTPLAAHAAALFAALTFCAGFRAYPPDYFVAQPDRIIRPEPDQRRADVRAPLDRGTQVRLALKGRGILYAMIYGFVFLTAEALRQSRLKHAREQRADELSARLAEARLQALRLQLQPHFLFNALNTITSTVREDPERAEEMIAQLSGFLRGVLNEREEVSLRTELALLDAYLAIQQARFGERLSIRREIVPETLDALVPTLVLQPLVENAIKHALEDRRGTLGIFITAERTGEKLLLRVADDGRGFDETSIHSEGVGLGNTRARLRAMHGSHQSFAIRANQPSGAVVEAIVPWKLAPPVPQCAERIPSCE